MEKNYVTVNRILTMILFSTIIIGCVFNSALCAVAYAQGVEIEVIENELEIQEVENNYNFEFNSLERIPIEDQAEAYLDAWPSLQEQEKKVQQEMQENFEQLNEFSITQLNEEPETEPEIIPEEKEDLNENVSNVEQETFQLVEETRGTVNEETLETALEEKQEERIEEAKAKANPNDVELLAQLMWAEEGVLYTQHYEDEPKKVEKVFKCCGSCVIHRKELELYGDDTLEEVIFSSAYHENTHKRVSQGQEDIPEDVYVWAEELLVEGPIGPDGLIYQSEFHQGDEIYYTAYNQIFCVETKYNNI